MPLDPVGHRAGGRHESFSASTSWVRQAAQGDVLHNDSVADKTPWPMPREKPPMQAIEAVERLHQLQNLDRGVISAADCSHRAWWRCATVTGWPCSSAAVGMRART
jgi:hypothetical protein